MKSGESKWALGMRKDDGSYYPRPKWVTDSMWERAQAALKQSWSVGDTFTGAVPAFAAGTFTDEESPVAEAVEETSPFADEDEEELAVAAAPVKRGPGRPKKS